MTVAITSITENLHGILLDSRNKIDDYCESQRKAADKALQNAQNDIAKQQQSLDDTRSKLLSLQMENKLDINEHKESIVSQIESQKHTNKKLQAEILLAEQTLEETKKAHKLEKSKVHAAHLQAQHDEMTLKSTIDDLTHGILNYKTLGLDFEKAEHGRLRFTFSNIVQQGPKCSFELETTDEELWNVVACQPVLDETRIGEHLESLNESNNMNGFVRGMRNLFREHLLGGW